MLIISNHLRGKISFPKETIVRVNMAWIKDRKELKETLNNISYPILLDLPKGRSKPPKPTLTMVDAMWAIDKFPKISYFAISNAENIDEISLICKQIKRVEIILKIETLLGVVNLDELIDIAHPVAVLLDKDDLYISVDRNNSDFNGLVDKLRKVCKNFNITLLELQGVVFSG